MKNLIIKYIVFIIALICRYINAISTNYDETFILPQYTYVEFLRSTVKLLETEYEPGSISAFLYLTGIKSTKYQNQKVMANNVQSSNKEIYKNIDDEYLNKIGASNNVPTSDQNDKDKPVTPTQLNTYDLLMFSSPNNIQFKNYIKAMQNSQYEIEDFNKSICKTCDQCIYSMPSNPSDFQINFSGFDQQQVRKQLVIYQNINLF